ncbi:MAG TPA: bifunctional shikimate kinase/3-dehydroquinate synthase [Gaiellaceae bacterium]|nr:bifunctional shikimate kinase/3-dehydroquinate synthase [Gaiellaceae bacterium]
MAALNALDRHLALVGFMGAGKTTTAAALRARLGRPVVDIDQEIEARYRDTIPRIFEEHGEPRFRRVEAYAVGAAVGQKRPAIIDLGGGAVTFPDTRDPLAEAFTVLLDVDVDTAWDRARRSDRPLARDESVFRRLYDERRLMYREVADAIVPHGDVDGVVLAAAGIHHERGAHERLGELVPGDGPVALVADSTVLELYGPRAREALGDRLVSSHELPPGEAAKQIGVVERLWSELTLDRGGTVVALGGGSVTDTAGFAAATYLRGIAWVAVPTTLVGQVDAAIGGKTAVDIPQGKNLAGAFHWPARVVIDEGLLETLPEREQRQGLAELVKTRLLAGVELDVRGAAAFKAGLCLNDPQDRSVRQWLNLGHTFAHALETAAGFELAHGDAVALGLLAALRLSGRDTSAIERELDPRPVAVDRERAWQALLRDKKRTRDAINLVLLGDEGPRLEARPADEVRAALDTLIT